MSFPKWLCRILSHMSAFVCGGYVYAAVRNDPPDPYRVVMTITFGLLFFIYSLPDKK